MSEATARFALPFILPGQAQKEIYHNEALARLDAALHPAVEEGPVAVPPVASVVGQCWIVAHDSDGAWAGKGGMIAAWSQGGWRFVEPQAGMMVWNKAIGHWIHWTGSDWSGGAMPMAALEIGGKQVVGERQSAILSASGGTVIDEEARAVLDQVIAALMSHGLIE